MPTGAYCTSKKALVFPDIAAIDCEKYRGDKNEDWLQLKMEEEGRREDKDGQGGVVVVIALTLRENIVATGRWRGAGHVFGLSRGVREFSGRGIEGLELEGVWKGMEVLKGQWHAN